MRIFKTFGLVIGGYLLAILASVLIVLSGTDSTGDSSSGAALIVLAIYWGLLATKVGYRWFDFLFLLIPIYGVVWMFRIAYRASFLPSKDWVDREDGNNSNK